MKKWYLHYDKEGKPAGFFSSNPDTPFIEISEQDKEAVAKDPLAFLVLSNHLCRIPRSSPNVVDDYNQLRRKKAPKVFDWYLATDPKSIQIALTGFSTGEEFHIKIITSNGDRLVLVAKDRRLQVMRALHNWLVNDNLKETN